MVIYVVSLCTPCLRYNICSAWFLDIRISICLYRESRIIFCYIDYAYKSYYQKKFSDTRSLIATL